MKGVKTPNLQKMATQNQSDILTIVSYNSTGFNSQRADFICDILETIDRENCIIAIQEHFIFDKNLTKIEKLLPNDLVVFSVGSFKDNSRIKMGRGKGGLSLIWHKSFDHITSRIQVKNNSRIQYMSLDLPGCKMLILNSYFPQDTQNNSYDEQDLLGCLSTIENILQTNTHDQAMLVGDLNSDFSRDTRFVRTVKTFCAAQGLLTAWSLFPIDFSYCSPCNTAFSLVDHIMFSEDLAENVINAGVIHRGDNVSGHSPVYLQLSLACLPKRPEVVTERPPKQNWKEATEADRMNYKSELEASLRNIELPEDCLKCRDLRCSNENHTDSLDNYIIDIIEVIETTSKNTIPYKNPKNQSKSKASKRKHIPGWREHVQPYKEEANFWYLEWRRVGKPRSGLLYNNMRFYRNKFRYARRRVLNCAEGIKRDRFVEAALAGDKDLFEELKRFKGVPQKVSSKVDGHTDPDSIADHFRNIYSGLYNRTGSKEPLKNLLDEVNEAIQEQDIIEVEKVTPSLIQKIIKEKIKPGKNDPENDLTTDNLKSAPYSLFVHLANFFQGILIHGVISASLLVCAIILLIKDKRGATDDSGNYRGIALSSVLLKVFDWIVLLLFDGKLQNDPNQFGYQTESSANMCTWTVIETVNYFTNRGSTVYACLLDYRKAFDFCNHVIMFKNLINRKINMVFIRLMITMYLHQSCYIKWQQARSYSFSVTNGTRQGGVFSPRGGFATYLDPLLADLRTSGYGCRIAGHWLGGLALADDVILLSLSVQGLQNLVNICSDHARATDLVFSTDTKNPEKSKTMCIAFNCKNKEKLGTIRLNGDVLPWKDKVNHLGYTLSSDCSSANDVMEKRASFISRVYSLNQEFSFATPETRLQMCRLYNTAFYGSNCWEFSSEQLEKFSKTWNVNLRIMFELPRETHSWIVEELSGGKHFLQMIYSRFQKYLKVLKNNKRLFLRCLYDIVSGDVKTPTGSNVRKIFLDSGLDPRYTAKHQYSNWRVYPAADSWTVPLLTSLLELRANNWQVNFDAEEEMEMLDDKEIDFMIAAVCTG